MNRRFALMLELRRVFSSVSEGEGLACSLVRTFKESSGEGREVAKRILLGLPVRTALEPLAGDESRELGMLAGLMAGSSSASARVLGRKGEDLSVIFEGRLKARETRRMEEKVMQTRGFIMSAVMGAVVALLASLGPLVGSLNFATQAPPQVNAAVLLWSGAAMTTMSSGMLGFFMSGRRFYADVLISLVVYALAVEAISPLSVVQVVGLWGIK